MKPIKLNLKDIAEVIEMSDFDIDASIPDFGCFRLTRKETAKIIKILFNSKSKKDAVDKLSEYSLILTLNRSRQQEESL